MFAHMAAALRCAANDLLDGSSSTSGSPGVDGGDRGGGGILRRMTDENTCASDRK